MSGHEGNHCHNWKPSEEFKELLGKIPPAKVATKKLNKELHDMRLSNIQVSQKSVCRSTLLQAFFKINYKFKRIKKYQKQIQVSQESLCRSTLLQAFAWAGNRSGVALLLKHGFVLIYFVKFSFWFPTTSSLTTTSLGLVEQKCSFLGYSNVTILEATNRRSPNEGNNQLP